MNPFACEGGETPSGSESPNLGVQPCTALSKSLPLEHAVFTDGMKQFVLDLCSGVDKPLSSAMAVRKIPWLAFDPLRDTSHDLLHDGNFEMLLRVAFSGQVAYCHAAPPCRDFSRVRLLPGGPPAIRTPQHPLGRPDLTRAEHVMLRERES